MATSFATAGSPEVFVSSGRVIAPGPNAKTKQGWKTLRVCVCVCVCVSVCLSVCVSVCQYLNCMESGEIEPFLVSKV